jgi:hypothetical protein
MAWPVPPKVGTAVQLRELLRLEVECPVPPYDIVVPDEWLKQVICGIRTNIELAVYLSHEVDDMHRFHIGPIAADNSPGISNHARNHGLSGYIICFAGLFERLIRVDVGAARHEFLCWPDNDDTAFSRLRLWAAGFSEVATPHIFCKVVMGLSDKAFWSGDHQRDLLLVLAARWSELSQNCRGKIEARLLKGPVQREVEGDDFYEEHKAWATLTRLQWLGDNNCEFTFDFAAEISARRSAAPGWKPMHGKHAADSREVRGGFVGKNTDHDALRREPIDSILSKAVELSGRSDENRREERDPFAGLCAECPSRAYLALTHAARRNEFPEWAWNAFLSSSAREHDAPRCSAIIAERLYRLPNDVLTKLQYLSTWWVQRAGKNLSKEYPDSFDRVISKCIEVLQSQTSTGDPKLFRTSGDTDYVTEALNSSVGHIGIAILEDSRLATICGHVDPSANWLRQLESLVNLQDGTRRHAIAILSHHLGWLHRVAPAWTESHLLSILAAVDTEDNYALWSGFLWNPQITSSQFYLRLKPGLVALVKGASQLREGHLQSLAILALSGWVRTDGVQEARCLSDAEFRDMVLHGGDDFRSHVLWQIAHGLKFHEDASFEQWLDWTLEFFKKVWPREKAVRNPTMSARLCEVLLASANGLPALVDAVLSFLTKLTQAAGLHFFFGDDLAGIVNIHAELLLRLLYTVLPEDASEWPYGVVDLLDKIAEAHARLVSDARLQELRRRWNCR